MYFLVYLIGVSFFALQIWSWHRLKNRIETNTQLFSALSSSIERDSPQAERCSWVRWINSVFPVGKAAFSGAWTRDDVEKELDQWITSDTDYLALQRTAIAAPMIGVVVTVIAFATVDLSHVGADVRSDSQPPAVAAGTGVPEAGAEDKGLKQTNLQVVIRAIRPLFAGVFTGALLALINQYLLHSIAKRSNLLREEAVRWFDTQVWSSITSDHEAQVDRTSALLQRMAHSMDDTTSAQAAMATHCENATRNVDNAASVLLASFESLRSRLEKIPEELSLLSNSAGTAGKIVAGLMSSAERAATTLDEMSQGMKVAVQEEFSATVAQFSEQMGQLAQSIATIPTFTNQLLLQAEKLEEAVADQSQTTRSLTESAARLGEASKTMTTASEKLEASLQHFVDPASTKLSKLADILNKLNDGADRLGDVDKKMMPLFEGLNKSAEVAKQLGQMPAMLQTVLEKLRTFTQQELHDEAQRAVAIYLDVLKQIDSRPRAHTPPPATLVAANPPSYPPPYCKDDK